MIKPLVSHLLFVRQEGVRLSSTAVVEVTHNKAASSPEELLRRIRKGVTQWCETTESGKACTLHAGDDVNIGDVAMYEHEDLQRCLSKFGILRLRILSMNSDNVVSYDTVLIESGL